MEDIKEVEDGEEENITIEVVCDKNDEERIEIKIHDEMLEKEEEVLKVDTNNNENVSFQ